MSKLLSIGCFAGRPGCRSAPSGIKRGGRPPSRVDRPDTGYRFFQRDQLDDARLRELLLGDLATI